MQINHASLPGAADSAALRTWAAQYRRFAEQECTDDPLYVAICRAIADTPELLALMQHAPGQQARPNLLLAALHERLLVGVPHALASYYPSCGGSRAPDAELPALLLDFASQEQPALIAHLRGRATQTNEVGRCVVLWPALNHIARWRDADRLALFDFGCSAGLNLGVEEYRYDYGVFQHGAPTPAPLLIACEWRGDAPAPRAAPWRLVARQGVDLAPVDVQDPAAVRWLQACLWPHDRVRAERLAQAVSLARKAAYPLRQAADGLAVLEQWLAELPAGVQPVLLNSWVLAYFDAPTLALHRERVAGLMRRHGLLWLSAEALALRPPALAQPPLPQDYQPGSSSLWTLQWADAGGALQQQALAWSHPHGRWLQWLALPP
ncbi:DUF2332 domain-containing protein [Roseateles sp.]|jgi:hypothetical protein|uniref:DUF2332 domain-containing protein n=1 Tax=Roseateles sp. TaxID=1971397 RepID=UPI0037C69DCA